MFQIQGRIIIDTETFMEENSDYCPQLYDDGGNPEDDLIGVLCIHSP
jgi:hypothetical protein